RPHRLRIQRNPPSSAPAARRPAPGARRPWRLGHCWRTLQHVTLSPSRLNPSRIGDIARAAPALDESGSDHL
ncbi:hypothetical protein, partial [Streptomyces alkaliterrae]|uniref:hypothetical protein n=1 Tax=Streptomyces alkaliterrae TaxID=2213162 RepID=UPI001E3EE577